jgi:hypothetical protein
VSVIVCLCVFSDPSASSSSSSSSSSSAAQQPPPVPSSSQANVPVVPSGPPAAPPAAVSSSSSVSAVLPVASPAPVAAVQNFAHGDENKAEDNEDSEDDDEDDDIPLDALRGHRSRRAVNAAGRLALLHRHDHESDSGGDDDDDEEDENAPAVVAAAPNPSTFDFKVGQAPPPGTTPHAFREKSVGAPSVRLQSPSAMDCLSLVFPYDLWVHMEEQTNIFGTWLANEDSLRMRKQVAYKPTTVRELQVMHALMASMSVMKFSNIGNYWRKGTLGCLKFPDFGRFMKR